MHDRDCQDAKRANEDLRKKDRHISLHLLCTGYKWSPISACIICVGLIQQLCAFNALRGKLPGGEDVKLPNKLICDFANIFDQATECPLGIYVQPISTARVNDLSPLHFNT